MKGFHQILDTTIGQNLDEFMNIAQCLQFYLEKIPKEEILQHLKFNREKMRNYFLSSLPHDSSKDMELIDRSIKKMEKGDFTLQSDLICKRNDLREFYMDPEERDKLEQTSAKISSMNDKVKKYKKIKKSPLDNLSSRKQKFYHYE